MHGRAFGDGPPTALLTPPTHPTTLRLPTPAPTARTRNERTLDLLRQTRSVLSEALAELSARHPDDPDLRARLIAWHVVGGIRFRS